MESSDCGCRTVHGGPGCKTKTERQISAARRRDQYSIPGAWGQKHTHQLKWCQMTHGQRGGGAQKLQSLSCDGPSACTFTPQAPSRVTAGASPWPSPVASETQRAGPRLRAVVHTCRRITGMCTESGMGTVFPGRATSAAGRTPSLPKTVFQAQVPS